MTEPAKIERALHVLALLDAGRWEASTDPRPAPWQVADILDLASPATVPSDLGDQLRAEADMAARAGQLDRLTTAADAVDQLVVERDALRKVVRHWHASAVTQPGFPPMTEWEDGDWLESGWTPAEAAAIQAALAGLPGPADGRQAWRAHTSTVGGHGHQPALVTRARSSCGDCDWSWSS